MPETQINVAETKTFIGLLIGGSVAFLFSALAIRAVGCTAGTVVGEVRQFADGRIMAGLKRPDYGPVIDICTAASLRELATPALNPLIKVMNLGCAADPAAVTALRSDNVRFVIAGVALVAVCGHRLQQARARVDRPRGCQWCGTVLKHPERAHTLHSA